MHFVLNGMQMKTSSDAFDYLANTLNFPEYFGRNLDALYDCLTDMAGAEIILMFPEHIDPKVMRVIKDASQSFKLVIP